MQEASLPSRRDALKISLAAAFGLPALAATGRAQDPEPSPGRRLNLGVASYSMPKATIPQLIDVLRNLRIDGISVYHTHIPFADGTPDQCVAAVQRFRDAGITVTSTGVINFTDEATIRRAFDNLRAAGVTLCCGRPTHEALPTLQDYVRKYDIKVAIHTHGPKDLYPTGEAVMDAVQAFDARIGLCLDVGHAWRAGADPAAEIRAYRARLYQIHMKDTAGPKGTGTKDPNPAIVGQGAMNIKGIVAALRDIGFAYRVDFEYELRKGSELSGLSQSVGFVRGMESGLA